MGAEKGEQLTANGAKMSSVASGRTADASAVNASVHCPACFRKLEQRQCKLICKGCGYYMSCSDYY